jgi:hypothetical protein
MHSWPLYLLLNSTKVLACSSMVLSMIMRTVDVLRGLQVRSRLTPMRLWVRCWPSDKYVLPDKCVTLYADMCKLNGCAVSVSFFLDAKTKDKFVFLTGGWSWRWLQLTIDRYSPATEIPMRIKYGGIETECSSPMKVDEWHTVVLSISHEKILVVIDWKEINVIDGPFKLPDVPADERSIGFTDPSGDARPIPDRPSDAWSTDVAFS